MAYLVSIIVPTKDRYEYLKPLISLVKGFDSDEIELVIQDNTHDNIEILDFIEHLNYQHLKYFHTPDQISVAKNADLAILNSTAPYVCFIGDDDGVSGHIISAVKWMERNEVDVLKSTMMSYKWPSFNFSKIADFSAVLMMGVYDKSVQKLDPLNELRKSLGKGGGGVAFLPKVYHGIAKRSTLDKVYRVGGTFFPGASPDIANAVAMCFVVENFVYLDFPIVIPGNSNRTGGDAQKYKGQCAPISEISFLPKDTEKNWENFIPKVWAAETIMPESACKSLKYMGKEDLIKEYFGREWMLAYFVLGHPELKQMALEKSTNKIKLNYLIFQLLIIKYFRAIYNKFAYKMFSMVYYTGGHTGGIFNIRNYYSVSKNLQTIHDANNLIMKKEKELQV
ncbi:MAG: glycosyltransferase [Kaistella sp.]|nr:glycosyltransferase [Kaistella sp.]